VFLAVLAGAVLTVVAVIAMPTISHKAHQADPPRRARVIQK
jgi:hypothetical protein